MLYQESILLRAGRNRLGSDTLSSLALDPSVDPKKRSKLLEKEMYEQAKVINDLRSLGASHGTIEQEMKRLHELETLVFKGFRRSDLNFFSFFNMEELSSSHNKKSAQNIK